MDKQARGRSRLPLAGLVAIVAALVPVGSASAVPPFRDLGDNTPFIEHAWVEFSGVEFDSQFTRVAAKVICPVDDFDPGGGSTEPCRARVGVTWFLEGKGVKGPRRGLAAPRDMVIERGASEHYEVRIPPNDLRNVLARAGGQALVGIGSVDPDTLYLQSNETLATPTFTPAKRTRWNSCGVQSFLRVAGATLLEEIRDADGKVSFGPLYSPDIQILTRYRVVKGTARFTLNGLRHELSEGSEFSVWCAGLNALHRGKTFPTLQLDKGAVRISGRPSTKRQFAAVVTTQEGLLGSRSQERVAITVTRNKGRRVSTLRMHKGRTGTVTPLLQHLGGSPCTAGKVLSVNWRGVIRPA